MDFRELWSVDYDTVLALKMLKNTSAAMRYNITRFLLLLSKYLW